MEVLQGMLNTYALFFDWKMWGEVLTSPVAWGLILSLVVLEGLLSADNALVLAVMVKDLPPEKQKKALKYGMWGAYLFRFIFIGLGLFLIKFWWLKALGAAYLAWLCIKHFWKGEEEGEEEGNSTSFKWATRAFGVFWGTVFSVEIMDLVFSVDSILAAFAVSDQVWVLLLGGMLGILAMRMVAGVFLSLINKIPELEHTAFILIGIIAVKMGLTLFDIHISHYAFFGILVLSFLATFVVHHFNAKKSIEANTENE